MLRTEIGIRLGEQCLLRILIGVPKNLCPLEKNGGDRNTSLTPAARELLFRGLSKQTHNVSINAHISKMQTR